MLGKYVVRGREGFLVFFFVFFFFNFFLLFSFPSVTGNQVFLSTL